jgi:hypothetical protein
MNRRQIRIVLASMAAVGLLWLLSPLSGDSPSEPAIPDSTLLFDAQKAFDATREFVTRHPRRILGSLEARQSTAFFRSQLQPLGYEITYSHFDATIANRTEVGRNVLAFRRGPLPEILVVMAHYDTARPTVQGAMDDGSGVGVLVELGRVLSMAPLRHSLLLVASDGEEWGMLGAGDLAENYGDRSRIVAALSLDYVAPGELADLQLAVVGLGSGYSPSWLRDLARKAAAPERLTILEPAGLQEHLERALLISLTDQGPLLGNGIPAINLGSGSRDRELEARIYHSPEDTIGRLKIASFEKFGHAAERILWSLDAAPAVPRDTSAPFRVTLGRYLSGPTVIVLHLLTFVPLVLGVSFLWRNSAARVTLAVAARELIVLVGMLVPCASVYSAIVVLTRSGRIPVFSGYPPGPGDPALDNPIWAAIIGLGVVLLLTSIVCFFGARILSRKLPAAGSSTSRMLTLTVLTAIVALGIIYNSYWAVAFLFLPAWVWVMAEQGRSATSRLLRGSFIVAAGLPWYALTVHYSHFLRAGWRMVWYEVLALSTGMFTPAAYFLTAMMVAAGIRLAALQFIREDD